MCFCLEKWGDDPGVGGCESMVTLAEMKGLSGTSHQKVSGTKKCCRYGTLKFIRLC